VPSTAHLLIGRFGTATVLIVIGIAAMVLAVRGAKRGQPGETSQPGPPAVNAQGAAPPVTPAVAGTSGTSDLPGTSGGSAATLHLAIAPTGPCWVQVTVNDQVVFATLLQPGDRRTVDAPSDVTLRVGDPAVFAFSINGKPARVPGVAGKAVTVHVRNENYSQFLVHQ
jgi:hypothetical protein